MGDVVRFGRRGAAPPRMRVARRAPAVTSLIGIIAFAFFVSAAGFGWLLGAFDAGVASPAIATAPASASFSICARASDTDCVVDGDTFRYDGRIIRIADIDTPETRDAMCAGERALGEQAKHRLRALLNAGPFTIAPYERSTDQYGRDLRIIRRNSESVGMVLVSEGLARAWDGRRHPWC